MKFKDFIKQFSNVSNKFIDDFFGIYDEDNIQNIDTDFIINLEFVSKWLKSDKSDLKKTLIRTYVENIDYIINVPKKQNTNGKKREDIMLTPECFKKICLLTRSKNGEKVREYYISMEEVLSKYKDHIIKNVYKKMDALKENQKPKVDVKKGLIYVLKTDKNRDDVFKIGKTKKFKRRLTEHNTTHEDNIFVAYIYEADNIDQLETCIKNALKTKQYRRQKEIFEVDLKSIKDITKYCDKSIKIGVQKPTKIPKEYLQSRQHIKEPNYFLYFHKEE